MAEVKTKTLDRQTGATRFTELMPALDLQARRIRWQTGVSDATARNIAHLAFGGGC